jgi:hypothetical protein
MVIKRISRALLAIETHGLALDVREELLAALSADDLPEAQVLIRRAHSKV